MYLILSIIILISNEIYSRDLYYEGISIRWRYFEIGKSNVISTEVLITLALSDQSFHLCDHYHTKPYEIGSDFGIECLDSWDNCSSWSFHPLSIECHSKTHEYPKSLIYDKILISLPSDKDSKEIYYKLKYPSSNYSCCWQDLNSSIEPVELISYLKIHEINSSPIARFPSHISIYLNKMLTYSLEVFDPEGDLFECQSLLTTSSILINEHCLINIKSPSDFIENEILIKIQIIEYFDNKKDEIRSRIPYHIIGLVHHENRSDECDLLPTIHFLNIENNQIHVLLNESIEINLISSSKCDIPMDECLINSDYHWKIKSIIEKNILNHQSQIEIEFEWIPKSSEQCGFHIHCIRCQDQLFNFLDRCITIFVYGPNCHNENPLIKTCSWSQFSIWSKKNQTTYQRNRTCHQTLNQNQSCSFCYGSTIEYQSSSAFLKDFELFEKSLLSPTRAHSTIHILLIITILWIITFSIGILISLYYGIKTFSKQKKS